MRAHQNITKARWRNNESEAADEDDDDTGVPAGGRRRCRGGNGDLRSVAAGDALHSPSIHRQYRHRAGEFNDGKNHVPQELLRADGQVFTDPFGPLVQHFFNHQTHHRGQVGTLLCQAGIDVGVTDLVALVRQRAA